MYLLSSKRCIRIPIITTPTTTLNDVTEATTLEGVKFAGDSSGMAYATFEDNKYKLYATFSNLPELPANLFYEGWIVGGAEGIVSTGELKRVNGGICK